MREKYRKRLAAVLLSFSAVILLTLLPQRVQAQCPFDAGFTASKVFICAGETVTFTNTTTIGASFFSWSENGNQFATTTNATRTFNSPGNFLIGLIASNGSCLDTATTIVVVNPSLNTSVSASATSCFGYTDGALDLSPSGGTPNLSLDNMRSTNDYVSANSVAAANYANGITVEAWLKPRSTWSTGDGLAIAFNDPTGGNRFFLGYNPDVVKYTYYDGNVGNQFQNGATSPTGQWSHLVITINTSNFFSMYINGVLRKSGTTNASWRPVSGDLFSIGQEWDGSSTSQHFDGFVDEVRIWNTPLSGATVLSNYQNSCGSISPTHPNIASLVAYYSLNEGGGSFVVDRSGNNHHGSRVGTSWGQPANNNYGCFASGTGYSYTWSNAVTTEDQSGLGTGTYMVTVTDGSGCQSINSGTVNQPPALVINVTPNPSGTICLGDSTQLNVTGANTYAWSPGTGLSGTSGSGIYAFPTTNSTYQVIGTDINGCFDTVMVPITVNPLPTAAISGTGTICDGDSSLLTATGGTGYSWSNSATTASTTVSPSSTTAYTVTVTDANGCKDTDQFTVNVNPLPVIGFSGTDTVCLGDTTMITASGGTSYAWSSGATSATAPLGPTVTTTYSVTVTDANTCSNTDSVEVVVNPLPVIGFSGTDTICLGDTTMITASGGTSYAWSSGATTATAPLGPTSNTTYQVTVTDANSCEAVDSIAITVNALPNPVISGLDSICAGQSTTLTASGAQSYLWSNSATTTSITISPAASGPVSVVGTDSNGCMNSDTFLVTVIPQLTASITPGNTAICSGDTITLVGSGGTSYQWSTSATTSSISVQPAATTTYVLTVSDGSSCDGVDSVVITVNPLPAAPVITQTGIVLNATPGFSGYQWYLNGSPVPGATGQSYTPGSSGNVTVTATDGNGCSATSAVFMYVNVGQGLAQGLSMSLYPNPNNGLFTLKLESDRALDLTVSVHDLTGRQVYARDLSLAAGTRTDQIDLQSVAKGVYILRLNSGDFTDFRKVVVE